MNWMFLKFIVLNNNGKENRRNELIFYLLSIYFSIFRATEEGNRGISIISTSFKPYLPKLTETIATSWDIQHEKFKISQVSAELQLLADAHSPLLILYQARLTFHHADAKSNAQEAQSK